MKWLLGGVALAALAGAALWTRSALFRLKFLRRSRTLSSDPEVRVLATGALSRDAHVALVYAVVVVAAVVGALRDTDALAWSLVAMALPVAWTVWLSRYARRDARMSNMRLGLEQRAHEVLREADLAPRRWAERLAPSTLPDVVGFDVGTAHQAGAGVMSGDFIDVFKLPAERLCCVVGDVTGHDVEASITAMQTKYLLRSYLRRYRDPGQALEELNAQLIDLERPEEFISVFVAVLDQHAGTVRYASAGHPPGWLCVERSPIALPSTGALLMMDPGSAYGSQERGFAPGDVLLIATDGLSEARNGDQFFGEERVAGVLRREADTSPPVLCKTLIEAAVEYAGGPLDDDVSVLAVRRA
jgi:serine phosphatase RsbU (regulator of sigma subunit)